MGEAKKAVDRMWEIVEGGSLDRLPEIVDPDCDVRYPGTPPLRGLDALKQMLAMFKTAFPDLRHHVRSAVEAGDTVALEIEVSGTQTGPMATPNGTVPASGRKFILESCDYVRVRNGKIASWHVYHDTVPFVTALGLA